MSKYFVNPMVRQPNYMAVSYHRSWIKEIKSALGSKCVLLQHVREDKKTFQERTWANGNRRFPDTLVIEPHYFLEARFVQDGNIKTIKFEIEGTPSDVSNKNYTDLKKDLLAYARTEKLI